MKTLLTYSIAAAAVFFNLNQASASQCRINIDVVGWESIEDVIYVAANGYALTKNQAEYKAMIDTVTGPKNELVMLSVLKRDGEIIFTKSAVVSEDTEDQAVNLHRAKIQLIRSLPNCSVLKFKS